MPNRAQRAFTALWQFMDLAIRVPPLFLLHWHLAEDLTHPLKQRMQQLEDSYGVFHFSLLVALVILVIIGVTMTSSQLVMSYSFLTPILLFHWNSLLSIDEQAEQHADSELKERNPNISFRALYTWPLLLYAVKDRISSPRRTVISVPFCFISLVFVGPGVFKFASALFMESIHNKAFSPPLAAAGASLVLLWGVFMDRRPLTTYVTRFQREARDFCSHEQICRSLCLLLKAPQILYMFSLFRMVGCGLEMMDEMHTAETSMTWIAFGEDLLIRCCDTTVSVVSLSCVFVKAIDYAISAMRALLQERSIEEVFKGEMFVLAFSLAYEAECLLLDRATSFHRLCQFLGLYAISRLCCIHQIIHWRFEAVRTDANPDQVGQKRVGLLLGTAFVFLTSAVLLNSASQNITAWYMTLGCIAAELSLKVMVTLFTDLTFFARPRWDSFENYLFAAEEVQRGLDSLFFVFFVWNSLYGALLFNPEIYCALDVRLFTYVNLWSQEAQHQEIIRRNAPDDAESFELAEATAEELIRLDDVCPICFVSMQSAIRTKCSHFFHNDCLRRWLLVLKSCPVCRSKLAKSRTAFRITSPLLLDD